MKCGDDYGMLQIRIPLPIYSCMLGPGILVVQTEPNIINVWIILIELLRVILIEVVVTIRLGSTESIVAYEARSNVARIQYKFQLLRNRVRTITEVTVFVGCSQGFTLAAQKFHGIDEIALGWVMLA